MLDGSLQNPFALVLFVLATLAAAVLARPMFRRQWWADERGLGGWWLGMTALLAVLMPLHVLNMALGQPLLAIFGREGHDTGLVEYLTFGAFALSAMLAANLASKRRGLERAIYLLVAVAAVYIAGEEVSWGQWIFHWRSPEFFAANNLQHETNSHNFFPPHFFEEAYSIGGWGIVAAVAAVARFGGPLVRLLPALSPLKQSLAARSTLLAAAVLMQHAFFQELSEMALGGACLYALGWTARERRADRAAPAVASPAGDRLMDAR